MAQVCERLDSGPVVGIVGYQHGSLASPEMETNHHGDGERDVGHLILREPNHDAPLELSSLIDSIQSGRNIRNRRPYAS